MHLCFTITTKVRSPFISHIRTIRIPKIIKRMYVLLVTTDTKLQPLTMERLLTKSAYHITLQKVKK